MESRRWSSSTSLATQQQAVVDAVDSVPEAEAAPAQAEAIWSDLDVAVIGGGPAGLAVALALQRAQPGLRLKVFEASTEYMPQGAGVGVNINGARALEAIEPTALHRLLEDAVYLPVLYQYNDETGEKMPWQQANPHRETLDREGFAPALVPWNSLRTAMYGCLPEAVVEFGCKVMECSGPGLDVAPSIVRAEHPVQDPGDGCGMAGAPEADDGWYTLAISRTDPDGKHAKGESVREVRARARYVIAADGYFSRIRRKIGDGQAPSFLGKVRWLGNISQADLAAGIVPLPAALDTQIDPGAMTSFHSWLPTSPDKPLKGPPPRSLNVYASGMDKDGAVRLVWSLYTQLEQLLATGEPFPMPMAAADTAGEAVAVNGDSDMTGGSVHQTSRRGSRALQRALAANTHLPADVLAMLAATPPDRVMEFGMYMHSEENYQKGSWVRGGLVLLGDAAHAGRPDGQGANLALEDAAVLGAMVRRHGLGPQAFAAWEESRQVRVQGILHDRSPDSAVRTELIKSAAFEPLWCPLQLSLPEELAQQVAAAVDIGGVEKGREVVQTWSRGVVGGIAMTKLAGLTVRDQAAPPPPAGSFVFR